MIGNITSPGILVFSLQCIKVSSKSNTIVFLLVGGKLTLFSSIIDYSVGCIVLEYWDACIVCNKCSLINPMGLVISVAI